MSKYYRGKRKANIFDPTSLEPYRISRSKIEVFMNCPRCFFIDRRLGVDRPPGYPFTLNSAVDALLKKEFDSYREKQVSHPLMIENKINALPFKHPKMTEWRDALRGGVSYHHPQTNLLITGGIDDIWINEAGELLIVDYKATSKTEEVSLEADWQIGYKRQMEIYQWLFRKNGFKVSNTGYFVYCNGQSDKSAFNAVLEFDIKLLSYEGKDQWVESTIQLISECLKSLKLPMHSPDCDFCLYRKDVSKVLKTAGYL